MLLLTAALALARFGITASAEARSPAGSPAGAALPSAIARSAALPSAAASSAAAPSATLPSAIARSAARPSAAASSAAAPSAALPSAIAPTAQQTDGPSATGPSATDPVATVDGLFDTLLAMDFPGIGEYVCAAKRQQVVERFDLSGRLASLPAGVDVAALVDGLTLTWRDRSATLVAADESSATVQLAGTLEVAVDQDAARLFIRQLLEAQGMEATDEVVDGYLPGFLAQQETSQDLDGPMKLTRETGVWLVCGGFSLGQVSPTPDASAGSAG
jgi:hypothetical protein